MNREVDQWYFLNSVLLLFPAINFQSFQSIEDDSQNRNEMCFWELSQKAPSQYSGDNLLCK